MPRLTRGAQGAHEHLARPGVGHRRPAGSRPRRARAARTLGPCTAIAPLLGCRPRRVAAVGRRSYPFTRRDGGRVQVGRRRAGGEPSGPVARDDGKGPLARQRAADGIRRGTEDGMGVRIVTAVAALVSAVRAPRPVARRLPRHRRHRPGVPRQRRGRRRSSRCCCWCGGTGCRPSSSPASGRAPSGRSSSRRRSGLFGVNETWTGGWVLTAAASEVVCIVGGLVLLTARRGSSARRLSGSEVRPAA